MRSTSRSAVYSPTAIPFPVGLDEPRLIVDNGLAQRVGGAIDRVDARWSGLASGLVNATLQIGAALSVAIIGGLFFARISASTDLEAIGAGFSLSLVCIAGALTVGAATIAGLRRR